MSGNWSIRADMVNSFRGSVKKPARIPGCVEPYVNRDTCPLFSDAPGMV